MLDELLFEGLRELLDCDEVLHDVDVRCKEDHVLLSAAGWLTYQRLQVLRKRRNTIKYGRNQPLDSYFRLKDDEVVYVLQAIQRNSSLEYILTTDFSQG